MCFSLFSPIFQRASDRAFTEANPEIMPSMTVSRRNHFQWIGSITQTACFPP